MRAVLLYDKHDIRIEDVSLPDIGSGEVLLKIKSSFICGTDVRMVNNGRNGSIPVSPLILGHELSGVIEKVGPKVSGYQPGMRVAVAPNMGCGICDFCVSGNTHLCPTYQALGINLDGAFAEYVRIPESAVRQGNIVEIADTVSFRQAALAEPLSCVYNAFERLGIKPGETVLVIGAGPIGIMHAKLARMAGAAKVIINDLVEQRLVQCRQVDSAFETVSDNVTDYVMTATNGRGVDVCVTACPAVAVQEIALELMAVNGRVVFFGGLPKGQKATLDTNLIHYRQLIVTGTTRSSLAQFRKTLSLVASGQIELETLVTSNHTIDEFSIALDLATRGIGLKNEILV